MLKIWGKHYISKTKNAMFIYLFNRSPKYSTFKHKILIKKVNNQKQIEIFNNTENP